MNPAILTQAASGSAVALMLGGMAFFSLVMAPLVFTKLPPENAGVFIRQVFPWYYLTMGGTTAAALVALLLGGSVATRWEIALTTLVLAAFIYARQVLLPQINSARDAQIAGDRRATARFARLHLTSVIINVVQLLAVFVVFLLILL